MMRREKDRLRERVRFGSDHDIREAVRRFAGLSRRIGYNPALDIAEVLEQERPRLTNRVLSYVELAGVRVETLVPRYVEVDEEDWGDE